MIGTQVVWKAGRGGKKMLDLVPPECWLPAWVGSRQTADRRQKGLKGMGLTTER